MSRVSDAGSNPMIRQREQDARLAEICADILGNSRNELYLNMRFLDVALSTLLFSAAQPVTLAGTEGVHLIFDPDALIACFRKGRVHVNRLFLHVIFHCVYGHPWNRRGRDITLWNLACDIADEWVIDDLPIRCLRLPPSPLRRSAYRRLAGLGVTVPSAGHLYRILSELKDADPVFLGQLSEEFVRDDHRYWNEEVKQSPQQMPRQLWEDIRDRMQTEMETFSREEARDMQSLTDQLEAENRKRYDYRDFLRKFAVWKEELAADLDSFDYIYYHYGLELYGNTPLIEPQETKEVHKIEDFVIVIDTSMSVNGDLVRTFLDETCSILQDSGSFFRQVNIRILQCDDQVREDTVIHDRKDLEAYFKEFELRGLGGTDFRPAFAYVAELLRMHAFTKLRGLIYFTDGYGTYPLKKPPYDTAFVFLRDHYRDTDVPAWAMKLVLEPQEIRQPGSGPARSVP